MKKNTKVVGLLVLLVLFGVAIYFGAQQFSTAGNCKLTEVTNLNTGQLYTSYDELRAGTGATLTNTEFQERGIIVKDGRLYSELCVTVVNS
jgi:hypothetical protein